MISALLKLLATLLPWMRKSHSSAVIAATERETHAQLTEIHTEVAAHDDAKTESDLRDLLQ